MTDFIQFLSERPLLPVYVGIAVSVMLVVELLGLSLSRMHSNRARINKRLQLLDDDSNREAVLMQLRRDRGLTTSGSFLMPLQSFNRLLVQSGTTIRGVQLLLVVVGAMAVATLAGLFLFHSLTSAVPFGVVVGFAAPLFWLRVMRNRRRAKFADQLPEALDIMVRSMRAGHPIPIAVSMVARELPDPIGTEFGMTADEMAYGLDLQSALQNMSVRVGQQDLPFVVVAISIQAKTGGNLAEVLSNLSRVIRDRFKLRRKVTAMSAEGRWSAGALSLIPLLVFMAINVLAPNFYGDVRHEPIVVPIALITLTIWATGIYIIYRLVNFRY